MQVQGKTIAITRPAEDAMEFISLMESHGGQVIPLRTIEVAASTETIGREFLSSLEKFDPDYCAFLSSKSVRVLFESAKKESMYDEMVSAIKNTSVVAVGPRTQKELKSFGIRAAHMPENYSSIGLGEMFTSMSSEGKKIIMPRSSASKSFLKELLEKIGMHVLEVRTYGVRAASDTSGWDSFAEKFFGGSVDGMAFTSASSVRSFFEILESKGFSKDKILEGLYGMSVFVIGAQADEECKKMHVKETCVSNVHTIEGLASMITGKI